METKKTLVERFAEVIDPAGYLLMGHSENLYNVTEHFKLLGDTIYKLNMF